jgi:hypothetical protein
MTMIGIHIAASMMLLRYFPPILGLEKSFNTSSIHALYSSKRIIVGCVILLFLAMFWTNTWLLTLGQRWLNNLFSAV